MSNFFSLIENNNTDNKLKNIILESYCMKVQSRLQITNIHYIKLSKG